MVWPDQADSDFFVVENDGRGAGLKEPLLLQSRSLSVKLTRLLRF